MLAIQAHCHKEHIRLMTEGLPRDAKAVVFQDAEPANAPNSLSPEEHPALRLQSQSSFAKSIHLNPADECWNDA